MQDITTPSTILFSKLMHTLITVSVQPDKEDAKIPTTKHFSQLNRVRAFTPEEFKTIIPELQQINQKDIGIFFTVNQGNGLKDPDSPENNLNCGKRKNITHLNTLIIDTDDADPKELAKVLKSIGLYPHITIRTSPSKYHLYFLLNPVTNAGQQTLMWKALQRHLASLVPGLDQSMSDVNQVLRIPGFYHLKSTPNLVEIHSTASHPAYNLEELYVRLKPKDTIETQQTYTKFEFPTGVLTSGSRRTAITRYIEHVMENVLPINASDADYFTLIDAFIIKYLSREDAPLFLDGGPRRANILQYYKDQKSYRINKHAKLQATAQARLLDTVDAVVNESLNDNFYLTFPGPVGQIVKDFHRYAPKLPLELAFAGSLFTLGALKADSYRYKGAWPLLNGLIIAGSGVGKSLVKTLSHEFLKQSGFKGAYSPLLSFQNTVQSLHTDLYAAGGVGVVMVDESGDYLQAITSKNAPSYARALKKYFKEATTAFHNGAHLSPGRSMSFQLPDIEYGMLGLWILIQPGMFEQTLSSDDMGDGFLPRFLVFNGSADIDLLSTYSGSRKKSYELSLDMQVLAQSFLNRSPYCSSDSILPVIQEAKQNLLADLPKAKASDIRAAQAAAVYRVRSEARLLGEKVEVRLQGEGEKLVIDYLEAAQRDAKRIQCDDADATSLNIYVRVEEMINRLLCCVSDSDGNVSEECVVRVLTWHKYMLARFFRTHLPALETELGEKQEQCVLAAVSKACFKLKRSVTHREIKDSLPGRMKRGLNLKHMLAKLVRDGDLVCLEVEGEWPVKGHKQYTLK